MVRERLLIVHFSGLFSDKSVYVAEYRIMQADGRPLPGWMDRVGPGLIAGKWPVNQETFNLRVIAILSDGATITRDVTIQTNTGEIKPLANQCIPTRPSTFFDQLQQRSLTPSVSIERLRSVLGH
jgi:hypothetical protein